MPYDNYGKKMGSYKNKMSSPKGFKAVKYSDRGERKGKQMTKGSRGRMTDYSR